MKSDKEFLDTVYEKELEYKKSCVKKINSLLSVAVVLTFCLIFSTVYIIIKPFFNYTPENEGFDQSGEAEAGNNGSDNKDGSPDSDYAVYSIDVTVISDEAFTGSDIPESQSLLQQKEIYNFFINLPRNENTEEKSGQNEKILFELIINKNGDSYSVIFFDYGGGNIFFSQDSSVFIISADDYRIFNQMLLNLK